METFDHIIIGGGALGLSIAYHLVRDSKDSVLVLERNDLASSASSKAAGLILQATSKPANTPLVKLTRWLLPQVTFCQSYRRLLLHIATRASRDQVESNLGYKSVEM
jgi:glycine/D-amino acid oxidase-like deaminating enzyme